eukprot:m.571525 g.571525  ORF g.571525 m.571525 type:complete len:743 (+) comp22267_c0_seq9:150-2378(+)
MEVLGISPGEVEKLFSTLEKSCKERKVLSPTHSTKTTTEVVLNADSDESVEQIPFLECREAVTRFIKPMSKEKSYVDFLMQDYDVYNADNEESGAEGDASLCCNTTATRPLPGAGRATVYVSHAWNANVFSLLQAILDHSRKSSSPQYYWVDIFCINQHAVEESPSSNNRKDRDWWMSSFARTITDVGTVLIVLAPYEAPMVCTRAWCLYEAAVAHKEGVPIEVVLPSTETDAFIHHVLKHLKEFAASMLDIDSSKGKTTLACDLEHIRRMIQSLPGEYAAVNKMYSTMLREWLIGTLKPVFDKRREVQTEEMAAFSHTLGGLMVEARQFDDAITCYLVSLKAYQELYGQYNASVGRLHAMIGVAYERKGDAERAIRYHEKSLIIYKAVYGDEHQEVGATHNNLGNACFKSGDFRRAIAYFKKSLVIKTALFGPKHVSVGTTYSNLGLAYHSLGDYDRAIEAQKTSLDICLPLMDDTDLALGKTYSNLGQSYQARSEHERAIEYFWKALIIEKTALGESHASVARAYGNLGSAYAAKGEHAVAINHNTKSLEILLQTTGGVHPSVAAMHSNIGVCYSATGDRQTALTHFQECVDISEKIADATKKSADVDPKIADNPDPAAATSKVDADVGKAYNDLGTAHRNVEQYAEAVVAHTKACSIYEEIYGAMHPNVGRVLLNKGIDHQRAGHHTDAQKVFEASVRILQQSLGPDHPHTVKAQEHLSTVVKQQSEKHSGWEHFMMMK